jgi:hypothetical protein
VRTRFSAKSRASANPTISPAEEEDEEDKDDDDDVADEAKAAAAQIHLLVPAEVDAVKDEHTHARRGVEGIATGAGAAPVWPTPSP